MICYFKPFNGVQIICIRKEYFTLHYHVQKKILMKKQYKYEYKRDI